MKNIVVLISGEGTNLQALISACERHRVKGKIAAVFSNNPEAGGLTRAQDAHIPTHVLSPTEEDDRVAFDAALADEIEKYQPDVIVLAGYMRILSAEFVTRFEGKILNIHPSLLPKYPGLHTHRQAMKNRDRLHGASVHFVTEALDGGPIVLQARVPIFNDDEEQDVKARVQTQEHTIYPLAINWLLEGRLKMKDSQAWLDGIRIPPHGYAAD